MTTDILLACGLPTWVFICGGIFRFFGGKNVADDEGLCNFGIILMLGSVIFALMVHSPNFNGG